MKRIEISGRRGNIVTYQPGDMTRYLFSFDEQMMGDGTTWVYCFSNLAPLFTFGAQEAIFALRGLEYPDNETSLYEFSGKTIRDEISQSYFFQDVLDSITNERYQPNMYTVIAGIMCWDEMCSRNLI